MELVGWNYGTKHLMVNMISIQKNEQHYLYLVC